MSGQEMFSCVFDDSKKWVVMDLSNIHLQSIEFYFISISYIKTYKDMIIQTNIDGQVKAKINNPASIFHPNLYISSDFIR